MSRNEMFAIDEVQLREIKDRYNIPGGTNQYFPLGHESGLGGLMVYFPRGFYGTKEQVAEDWRRIAAPPHEIAAQWEEVRKLKAELEEMMRKRIASRKLQRFIYRPINQSSSIEHATVQQRVLSSFRSWGRRLVHAFRRHR